LHFLDSNNKVEDVQALDTTQQGQRLA